MQPHRTCVSFGEECKIPHAFEKRSEPLTRNNYSCRSVTVGCTFIQKYWWVACQIQVVAGYTTYEMTESYLCMSVKAVVPVRKGCGPSL